MESRGLKRNKPLRSKTPLRSKGGFKPSCGAKDAKVGGRVGKDAEKPPQGKEKPRKARGQSRSSLVTHLDIVFSVYIRLRDAISGGMARCISCGRVFPFQQIQCGHYYTRHNMATRWDEDNCHAQCVECNCHKSGNIEGYTLGLEAKIGEERLAALGARARGVRKWSGEELRGMIRHYTEEARRLSAEKGIDIKI